MATCCKSNSTFLIFAVLVVWCIGRVAVKHCFKLLSFFLHLLVLKTVTHDAIFFISFEYNMSTRILQVCIKYSIKLNY